MSIIKKLSALEILDSRGRPTVEASCQLASGSRATASVPSGASTGQAEALELRDGDARYNGLGCQKAVHHIVTRIQDHLKDKTFENQTELDEALLALDGTPNKANLGANAILAVSLAFARAQALEKQLPLYQHFANMAGVELKYLPRLTINLFSGGKHAGGQVVIQDVLVVPTSAKSIRASLEMTYTVLQSAIALLANTYQMRPLKADEGGLAPNFVNEEAMIRDAVRAIEQSGLKAGEDVALAMDVASSHFYENGHYHLGNQPLSAEEMIGVLEQWSTDYPIISIEDGLAEEDWSNWPKLKSRLGEKALILGDDFLCTNPERIKRAAEEQAANALLLKVNQIGTLSEAASALKLARKHGWQVVVSARSGETEDNWLADLATGWQADFIKVGSIQQSERLAKYNRLLAIEAETGLGLRRAFLS